MAANPPLITAVQERYTCEHAARVLFGAPQRRAMGTRGPILLFGAGSVVGYRIRVRRYSVGCIFRTASAAAEGGDVVPGVRPAPHLLVGFVRGRQLTHALMLLRELGRRGIADTLPNAAYLCAAASLSKPHFDVRLLANALEGAWTC